MKLSHVSKTPLAPGELCDECCPHYRADNEEEDRQPQPAVVRVYLHPDDFDGLNLGPDVAGEVALCAECLASVAPFLDHP